MTRKHFIALLDIAKTTEIASSADEMWQLVEPFDGCALHCNRIIASTRETLCFLRYQCLNLNGTWDHAAIEFCADLAKRIDLIEVTKMLDAA